LAATAAAATVLGGCATNGLGSLPLPAPGIGSGGYLITAVFSNALNLPAHAKVKLAGADIGQLEASHHVTDDDESGVYFLKSRVHSRLPHLR